MLHVGGRNPADLPRSQMVKTVIRNYQPSDYQAVKSILIEAGLFSPRSDTKQRLDRKITHQPDSILVADINKQIIGCIYLIKDHWVSLLFRFAISKKFRQQSHGSKLLKKAETLLKKQGFKTVILFVENDDKVLVSFYKKRGYRLGGINRCLIKPLEKN
ncbi:TPA: hypothetical protein DEQ95_03420 [Candidatus Beckwithbacteria bacterium]|nr:hypothetical protein [Candidatus Beckwithbacteria bacterium]HAV66591.1 hypothetical protein [Candidatus Beckwithbacteria bacterium]HBU21796.1 hypothetical protein [Candidatus Beckwithbacteria bacterium]HCE99855.1 hypothetical protein [Candidatus Beckwithbacteria bacterium]HCM44184.1 hypothetical protein [Candidatus Beckwithbacteria bacterium]